MESKKPDCLQERDNNLANSRNRRVIERDSDEESVGTLMKDEDNDKVGKIIEKAVDKVKIWKESANMKMSTKKEISHLELKRH